MFRINAMQLVGLEKEEGMCISWRPDGILLEMPGVKLESLRSQYEAQVQALRLQLEQERRAQTAHHGDGVHTSDVPATSTTTTTASSMTTADKDLAEAEAALKSHLLGQLRAELETSHQGTIDDLQRALSDSLAERGKLELHIHDLEDRIAEQESSIEQQREQIKKQTALIEEQRKQFQSELTLQLHAQRITLDGVNASRLSILKEDLKRHHETEKQHLQDQISSLHLEMSSRDDPDLIRQQAEEDRMTELDKLRSELEGKSRAEQESLKEDFDRDKAAALQALTEELQSQHEDQLRSLELKFTTEKDEAVHKLRQDLEEAKAAMLQSQLREIENKHARALQELHDELTAQKEKALEDLRQVLEDEHIHALNASEEKHTLALAAIRDDIEQEHQGELDALQSKLESERDTLLSDMEAKLENEQEQALKELENRLNDETQKKIDELKESFRDELSQTLKHEKTLAIEELTDRHDKEIQDLEKDWELKVQQRKADSHTDEDTPSADNLPGSKKVFDLLEQNESLRESYEAKLKEQEAALKLEIEALRTQLERVEGGDHDHLLKTPRSASSTGEFEDGVLGTSQNSFRGSLGPTDNDFMYVESDDEDEENSSETHGSDAKDGPPAGRQGREEIALDTQGSFDIAGDLDGVDEGTKDADDSGQTDTYIGYNKLIDSSNGVSDVVDQGAEVADKARKGLAYDESFTVDDHASDTDTDVDGPEQEDLSGNHRTTQREDTKSGSDLVSYESDLDESDETLGSVKEVRKPLDGDLGDGSGSSSSSLGKQRGLTRQKVVTEDGDEEQLIVPENNQGWNVDFEGSEDDDEDFATVIETAQPPQKKDLPIVVIQHSDSEDPHVVHDFYATLEELEATDVGSDKKWIKHLEGRIEDYERELEGLRERMEIMEDDHQMELEETLEKIREYEEEINRLGTQQNEMHKTVADQEAQLRLSHDEQEAYKTQIATLKESLSSSAQMERNIVPELQSKIGSMEEELEEMRKSAESSSELLMDEGNRLTQSLSEIEELKDNARKDRQTIEQLENKHAVLQEKKEQLELNIASFEAGQKDFEDKCVSYDQEIDKINRDLYLKHQENEELKEKLKLCEQELEEVKDEAEIATGKFKDRLHDAETKVHDQAVKVREYELKLREKENEDMETSIEYEQKIKKLEEDIIRLKEGPSVVDQVDSLNTKMKHLQESHQLELEALRQELEDKYLKEMDSLQEDFEERSKIEKDQLKEQHEQEIESLNRDLSNPLRITHVSEVFHAGSPFPSNSSNGEIQMISKQTQTDLECEDHWKETSRVMEEGSLRIVHVSQVFHSGAPFPSQPSSMEETKVSVACQTEPPIPNTGTELDENPLKITYVSEVFHSGAPFPLLADAEHRTDVNPEDIDINVPHIHEPLIGVSHGAGPVPSISTIVICRASQTEEEPTCDVDKETPCQQYIKRIAELENDIDRQVARCAEALEAKHERELEQVKASLSDYRHDFERFKFELSDSYAQELNRVAKTHAEEKDSLRCSLTARHANELADLQEKLERKLSDKILELTVEMTVRQAQELAVRQLMEEKGRMGRVSPDYHIYESAGASSPGFLPNGSFGEHSGDPVKHRLDTDYKKEMEKVKAELQGLHMESLEELRSELLTQHGAELYRVQSDLSFEHQRELEHVNAELVATKERLQNIQTDLEVKHGLDIQNLRDQIKDKEVDIRRLNQELNEVLEEKSKATAKHIEDMENLKNDMSRKHDEQLEGLRIEYENIMIEKEALWRSETENNHETLLERSEVIDQLVAEKDSLAEKVDCVIASERSLQRELEILQAENKRMGEILSQKEHIEEGMENVTESKIALENEIIVLQKEKREGLDHVEQLVVERNKLSKEVDTLAEAKLSQERELQLLLNDNKDTSEQMDVLKEENQRLLSERERMTAEMQKSDETVSDLMLENKTLIADKDVLLAEKSRLENELKHFEEDRPLIEGYRQHEERLEEERRKLEYEWRVFQDEKEQIEAEKIQSTSDRAQIDEEWREAKEKNSLLQRELQEIVGDKHSAIEERYQLQLQNDSLRKEKEALQDAQLELENESKQITEMKEQLKAEKEELDSSRDLITAEKQKWLDEKEEIAEFRVEMLDEQERLRQQRDSIFQEIEQKARELDILKEEHQQLLAHIEQLKLQLSTSEALPGEGGLGDDGGMAVVDEPTIHPEVASICGNGDEDETKGGKVRTKSEGSNISEVTEVTEEIEEDVEVMSDTFESLTHESQASSKESLKAELEAAEIKATRSLSFSTEEADEDDVPTARRQTYSFEEDEDEEIEEDIEAEESDKAAEVSHTESHVATKEGELHDLSEQPPTAQERLTAMEREINEREVKLAELKQQYQQQLSSGAEESPVLVMDVLSSQASPSAMKDRKMNGSDSEAAATVAPHQNGGVHTNGGQTLEEEYESVRQGERDTLRRHEQLLAHLRQEHLEELDKVKVNLKEELLAENMRKLEEMTGELEQSHQSEMEELRKELDKKYLDQIHFLEEELERTNDDAEKALEEMRDKYEHEIKTLRQAAKQNARGGDETDSEGGSPQEQEVARLTRQHEEELQELEQEHQQKLSIVEKYHADAMEKQRQETAQKLAASLEDLRRQLEEEKQEELTRVHDTLEGQIQELRQRLEERVEEDASGHDIMDGGSTEELERRMDQIGRLSELLAERGDELTKAQEEVAELERRLADQKEDYELLAARLQTESESDHNQQRMLQSDLERLNQERDNLQQTNDRLLQILSDTVKINLVAEDRINRRLSNLVAEGGRVSSASATGSHRESGISTDRADSSDLQTGPLKGEETLETSAMSVFSDEGLDLSQRVNESLFNGPDLDPDGEDVIIDAGQRLQQSVERLLDMVVTTTRQLHDAQSTQRDLVSSLSSRSEEAQSLGVQVDELNQRLRQESEAKDFLAVELNKAEGLIQGYADEKRQLEDLVANLEEKKEMLIIDLERAHARLRDLEDAEDEIVAREDALERQQQSLEKSLNEEDQVESVAMATKVVAKDAGLTNGPPQLSDAAGLLHEVQRLMDEKRDILRQADKDRETLEARNLQLEQMVEELQMTYEEQLEQKKVENDDLLRQVDVMEKKTKSNNMFLEEQTLEREQEREDYQREVTALKALVKEKEKSENAEHRLQREVAELEEQLSERINLHSQALLKKEDVERELAIQEANVRSLQEMVRQLEEELEAKTREEQELRQKLEKLEADLLRQQEASEELTGEIKKSIPPDELKRLVSDLESQLETIQKSEKLASQKVYQKEEELRNMKTMEEELQHDKTSLQQEVNRQLTELSTLRTQMEELKLNAAQKESAAAEEAKLRVLLQQEREALENKTREVHELEQQLESTRRELLSQTEQVQQLTAELEVSEKERRHQLAENTRRTAQLHDENNALKSEIRSLREKIDSTPLQVLNQDLLDEKNEEIDFLNNQLNELEERLANNPAEQEVERLTKVVVERTEEVKTQNVKIEDLEEELEKMRESADLMAAVKNADAENGQKLMKVIKEKGERITVLEKIVAERDEQLTQLETDSAQQVTDLCDQLKQKDIDMAKMQEDYETQREADLHSLQETIRERESTIDDMSTQVESLQHEITGLRDFQAKLQEDFDTVQTMLEEKQREIEAMSREFSPQTSSMAADLQRKYESEVSTLQKEVRAKQVTIDEKEEELYTLQEKVQRVEGLQRNISDLKEALEIKDRLLVETQEENRALEDKLRLLETETNDDTNIRLQQQIQEQETVIEQLQEELSLSQTDLKKRQEEFNRAIAELENQKAVVPPPKVAPVLQAPPRQQPNLDELKRELHDQLRQDYEQRLHNKILELESSHKHQVEALQQQFEQERKTLREETRREMERRHEDELSQLLLQHEEELARLRSAMDLSDDDSILEAGRRLNAEIDRGERIDSRVYSQMALLSSAANGDDPSSRLQHILNKIEAQGVRLLSLSEMESLRRHVQQARGTSTSGPAVSALQEAWEAEKHALMAAVQALKDLLAETQRAHGAAKEDDGGADWRADLLRAISYVFAKEHEGLLTELRTHVVMHGDTDQSAIRMLENKIKEMNVHHNSALKQIFSADRQSMLAEIRDLRAHLSVLRLEKHDERGKLAQQLSSMEEQLSKRERHLRRQLELLEYKVQQEKVLADDLRSSLEIEKSRTVEMSSQLSRERNTVADLQSELVDTQTQLAKMKDALEREQARLLSASAALEEERKKTAKLTEALTVEQMSTNQVGDELESERLRIKQQHERNQHLNEKLRREIESEKERGAEVVAALERERLTSASLRRELELEREQHHATDSKYRGKIAELRATADTQKARNDELNTSGAADLSRALQRERQLTAQLRDTLDEERGSKEDMSARERAAITDLHALLDLERSKLLDLQRALEKERRKVSSLNSKLDLEQSKAQDILDRERATCRQLKVNIESVQVQKSDLQKQVQFTEDKVSALEADRARLQESLETAKERMQHLEAKNEADKTAQRELQRSIAREQDSDRQRQYDADMEISRLRQKVVDLEHRLETTQEQLNLERVKASAASAEPTDNRLEFYKNQLETLRERLHVIVTRHQEELAAALRSQIGPAGSASLDNLTSSSKPELEGIGRVLREILSELQQVHGVIAHDADATPSGTPSAVSHTSDELLSATYYRMEAEASEDHLASERATWSQERGSLTLQLHSTQKELSEVKNRLRRTEIQLEREREKYITPSQNAVSTDKEKMQRLYGKYLRAESFRKALIYQKKYLLLLLGGFQDCEEQTLAEIAKMGVYPAYEDLPRHRPHPRPYSRFRSAVRVVVAVSRMKYMVKKWQRASRVGSSAVTGVTHGQNGTASSSYIPSSAGFAQPRRYFSATAQHQENLSAPFQPGPSTSESLLYNSGKQSQTLRQNAPPNNLHTTPPTRDISSEVAAAHQASRTFSNARRQLLQQEHPEEFAPVVSSQDSSLDDYIQRLEHIQARLSSVHPSGTSPTFFVR